MLPGFLLYLIWVGVALVLPVAQSLHALHLRNDKEIRTWLFYWIGYTVCSIFFPPIDMVAGAVVPLWGEIQIGVLVALVVPKFQKIDMVIVHAEQQLDPVVKMGLAKFNEAQALVLAKMGGEKKAPAE